jgi:tripartite-type tricarboxylate transporter receptor subunit TctC
MTKPFSVDRRRMLGTFAVTALAGATGVRAQGFPAKPIKIIVGFAPGGAVDIIARAVGNQLSSSLGQPVVIDNRPGAGTNIAMRALVDSPPDGYTLMLAANSLAANPSLYTPPPLDPARDITPISLVGRVPVVLAVGAGTSIDSLQAFIAAAKAKPRGITFGSPGNGSTPHLAIALLERRAGIQLSHIPYKGGAPAITDVLGGHIAAVAVNALEVQPHVKSGKLRVLAVMSPSRSGIFPDVPTVAESGFPGFEAAVWYVFIGPAGLPAPVVTRLHADIQRAMATEEVRSRLTTAGGEVLPGPVERATTLIAEERARYEKLIREEGIKPD